jgi:N-hydroxyarylamine O-acetyltransferase
MGGLFLSDLQLSSVDPDAYCERIGYSGPREPTLSTLVELHRLHPAAIPFENIDVRLGLSVSLDPGAVDAKLIRGRRGGYCFEQNTLFLRALRTLGFTADPLIARSRWRRPADQSVARTHIVIRVQLSDGDWLADVGFGACMLTSPMRMDRRGAQPTRHEPVRLAPIGEELRVERLLEGTWEPLCDVVLGPQEPVDLLAAHWLISTHPGSSFRHHLVVSRTQDHVRHVLVDARLTVRRSDGEVEHRELDGNQIEECLVSDFELPVRSEWRPLFAELAASSAKA